MAWVNLDDGMPEHPKNWALSDAAFRLHVAGICYCNRQLTDGLISADKVPTLAPRYRKATLAELVDKVIWLPLMDGQLFEIRDYLDWNRSREQVLAERDRKSKGGRKGAATRWGNR